MWPPQALEFLRELEDNNDRTWFKANRARYDDHLRAPGQALAESLADLGEPRSFRPYNDARFHHRPPIKEQLGIAIGYGPAGGYYVEPELKRAPRGYPVDHPRVQRLRLKNLTVFARHGLEPWLYDERCRAVVLAELESSRPLVTWLAKHVGPPAAG